MQAEKSQTMTTLTAQALDHLLAALGISELSVADREMLLRDGSRDAALAHLLRAPELLARLPRLRTAWQLETLHLTRDDRDLCRKVVLGALGTRYAGWISTDQPSLDLTKPEDFSFQFRPGSVHAFLAEHVWEHLDEAEGLQAAQNCFGALAPGGRLRIAVPDGCFPSQSYIDYVRPGGFPGHRVLYDYRTLPPLLAAAGFAVRIVEHFKEDGLFSRCWWSSTNGHVQRSYRHDRRNRDGAVGFTSLIVDAWKPAPKGQQKGFRLGAATPRQAGWDLLQPEDLIVPAPDAFREEFLGDGVLQVLVSEDLLHLFRPEDRTRLLERLYAKLAPGGVFRCALPDGGHPDPDYRARWCSAGPPAPDAAGLRGWLEAAGFSVSLREGYDQGHLVIEALDPAYGRVARSARAGDGSIRPDHSALIVDARKQV